MPRKNPLSVRLHAMVSPATKQRIEGCAERLSRDLGRVVSEASVLRAALEQTDFAKLALIAAPAAEKEVPRERTTLTPEQAAIIESLDDPRRQYAIPHRFMAGMPSFVEWKDADPKTIAGVEDAIEKIAESIYVDSQAEPVRTDVHYVVQLHEDEWIRCGKHPTGADAHCPYCTTTKIVNKKTVDDEAKFAPFQPGDLTGYALEIRKAQESALAERPE